MKRCDKCGGLKDDHLIESELELCVHVRIGELEKRVAQLELKQEQENQALFGALLEARNGWVMVNLPGLTGTFVEPARSASSCECGATKSGDNQHSTWCPVKP